VKYLLAVLLLVCSAAHAETVTFLTASLASYHFERQKGYCETNPGVGIEHGNEDLRFVAGTYHNSLCLPSDYIGVSWSFLKLGNVRLGMAGLAITGYQKNKRGTEAIYALLPVVAYEGKKWGANVIVIPPYDDFQGCLGFQVKWRF